MFVRTKFGNLAGSTYMLPNFSRQPAGIKFESIGTYIPYPHPARSVQVGRLLTVYNCETKNHHVQLELHTPVVVANYMNLGTELITK
jgi:hypothetical protein